MKRIFLSLALGLCCLLALSHFTWAAGLGGSYTKNGAETPFTNKASLQEAVDGVKSEITKLVLNAGDLTSADWTWLKGETAKTFARLEEFEVATTMTSVAPLEEGMYNTSFYDFPKLKKLTVAKITTLSEGVFKNVLRSLEEISLPDVQEIKVGVFCYFDGNALPLRKLSMPRCKKIGNLNFTESQANLALLVLGPNPPEVGSDGAHWSDHLKKCALKLVKEDGTDLSTAELAEAKKAYLASNNTNGKWLGFNFDGAKTFEVKVAASTHGKLEVSNTFPSVGEKVMLTAIPDEDKAQGSGGTGGGGAGSSGDIAKQWMLDLSTVKIFHSNNGVKITPEQPVPFDDKKMTFVMPESEVLVEGTFVENKIKVTFTSFEEPMTRTGASKVMDFEGNMMKDILNSVTHEMGKSGKINDPQYRTKVTDVEVKGGAFTAIDYVQFASQFNVTGSGFDNAYKNIQIFTVTDAVSSHTLNENAIGSTLHGNVREVTLNKLPSVGNKALAQLANLTKLVLPHTTRLKESALSSNEALKTLEVPVLEFIENGALKGCTSLVSLKLPRLHTISKEAFAGCTNLATLYLGENPPTVEVKDGVATAFNGLPAERSIILVDNDGNALQGTALTEAAKRYLGSAADGNATDQLFFGWKIVSKDSYEIKIGTSEHGRVNVPERAVEGDNVKVTVVADDGYTEKEISYVEEGSSEKKTISLDTRTFVMPAKAVTISVEYKESEMTVKVNGDKIGMGKTLKDAVAAAGFSDNTTPDLSGVKTLEVTAGVFGVSEWKNLNTFFAGTDKLERFVLGDAVRIADMPGSMVIKDKTQTAEVTIAGESLAYVKIPKITALTERAFNEAKALETIECPDVEALGENAFRDCKQLKTVTLPKLAADKIVKGAFVGCESLEEISLPELTEIPAELFSGCKSLKALPFADKVTSISDGAFKDCEAFTALSCPRLTYIGKNAFDGCKGIASLTLPLCENIGAEAFQGCKGLTTLSLPALTTVGSGAFANLTNLESVDLPKLKVVEELCFNGCEKLKTVSLPIATSIGDLAFCTRIIKDPEDEDKNEYHGFEAIETLTLPEVTSVGERALWGCKNLKQLNAPKLQTLGPNALEGCESLSSVEFNALRTIGYKSFARCTGFTTLTLPALEGVAEQAFFQCAKLAELVAPSLTQLEDRAFEGCNLLASLTLGATVPRVPEDKNPFASKPQTRILTLRVDNAEFAEVRARYLGAQDGNPADDKWYGWSIAELSLTKVFFTVKVGAAPVVGAAIAIRNATGAVVDSKVADGDGKTVFFLAPATYTYEVTADGYKTQTAELVVEATEKTVDVVMEAVAPTPTHVVFTVKKGTDAIAGAKIVVKDKATSQEAASLTTSAEGKAECNLVPATYTYEVTAEGCAPIAATEFVVEATEKKIMVPMTAATTPPTHIVFTVKKGEEVLAGAKIVVKDKATSQEVASFTTTAEGKAECNLAPATYTYEVTAEGCTPIEATEFVVGAEEKTVEVTMTATEATKTHVVFSVKKGTDALVGAKIVVKDKTTSQEAASLTTSAEGKAECDLVPATYTYEVTAEGCTPIEATEFVVGAEEKTVEVTMTAAEATKTHVLFTVKKGEEVLAGAKIVVKDKATSQEAASLTTSAEGKAACDLVPATYTYEVTAEGYTPIEATDLVVESEEKTVEVTMTAAEATKTHVVFTVKKGTDVLAGAKIVVKDKATSQEAASLTTSAEGKAACDLVPATYTYEVTAKGCTPIAATEFVVGAEEKKIEVTMTAVANNDNAVEDALFASVVVTPNPFTAQLRIVNPEGVSARYELVNASGVVVRAGVMQGNEEVVDTESLPAGLYFVRLIDQNGAQKTVRVVRY